MGKKHPERSRKRRQARAERRRVEAKQRKTAERARLQGVARKDREVEEVPEEWELFGPRSPVLPPPEDEVEAFHAGLERLSQGEGDLVASVESWSPAVTERDWSEIEIDVRLFGIDAEVGGSIGALRRADELAAEDGDEHEHACVGAARRVLDALRRDREVARSMILLYALDELLVDYVGLDATQVRKILSRLGIAGHADEILEPLAQALPAAEKAAWDRARQERRWYEDIGEMIVARLDWFTSGSLLEFAEEVAEATNEAGWRAPWYDSRR